MMIEILLAAVSFFLLALAFLIAHLANALSRAASAYEDAIRRGVIRISDREEDDDEPAHPPLEPLPEADEDSPYALAGLTEQEAYELERAARPTAGTTSSNTSAGFLELDEREYLEEEAARRERSAN